LRGPCSNLACSGQLPCRFGQARKPALIAGQRAIRILRSQSESWGECHRLSEAFYIRRWESPVLPVVRDTGGRGQELQELTREDTRNHKGAREGTSRPAISEGASQPAGQGRCCHR